MKKIIFTLILLPCVIDTLAQTTNKLYGIVRKNYYSLASSPLNPTVLYEQFDSATIRLGYTDPTTGIINNIGTVTYNQAVNLTGAALNPYQNSFIFIGLDDINTFDLATGNITNRAPLFNPIAASYFDNFRFNNADSSMYGLARRNFFDSSTMTNNGEVYLAKANTQTGLITQISPVSVAQGFALAGSAIDPYQMVYYFSTGSNLVGLDIYDGSVRSNVPITIPDGNYFDNFTYSCADTALYGLVRKNYFSNVRSPFSPNDSIQVLDSATIKLGKINPTTGAVTIISPASLTGNGYTLNGSSAIDPVSMTYYYNTGNSLVGVSLATGFVTSNATLSFTEGNFFELMRNFENCKSASALRPNPSLPVVDGAETALEVQAFPNPFSDNLTIKSKDIIRNISLTDITGRIIYQQEVNAKKITVNMSRFSNRIYVLKVIGKDNKVSAKKIVKN